MEYRNNKEFENESSALIVFVTFFALAVSLLGIIISVI